MQNNVTEILSHLSESSILEAGCGERFGLVDDDKLDPFQRRVGASSVFRSRPCTMEAFTRPIRGDMSLRSAVIEPATAGV